MPRYFFDIHDGIHVIDHVGQEMADIAAAKAAAIRHATAYVADPKMLEEEGGMLVIVVRSDPDTALCTFRLSFNIKTETDFAEEPIEVT